MPHAFAMFHRALPATSWKRQSLRFQLQERATLPCIPLRLETIKDRQTGILFAVGKVLPSLALCIYLVAMSASSDALEASIASFSAAKEGDVPRRPLRLRKLKDRRTGICLPSVKRCHSHAPFICYVVMRASSDELEAPITAFSGGKEGDVASSPSPLENNQRSANRSLFAVSKVLPFACPLHLLCCNEGFQRRAGSTNHCVFRWKRGRRCLVALSAWKQSKIGKQVFCLPSGKCSLRVPSAYT